MQTTIDSAGRLVIPREVRDQAGLRAGATLKIRVENGCVVLEPTPMKARLERRGGLRVIVPSETVESLTVEQTRQTLEEIRKLSPHHRKQRGT
jgi:AbrB family looped-hinge helix DNA binding protein